MAERRGFTPRSFVPEAPQVGAGETFLNRAVNALPAGRPLVDAISAAGLEGSRAVGRALPGVSRALASLPGVGALAPVAESDVRLTPQAQAELERMGSAPEQAPADPGLVGTYRNMRDTRAERTEAGSQQNPWAGRAGTLTGLGLSLLAPLPKAPGSGVGSSVATGTGYGALAGLTDGEADLTRGEFSQAAVDVTKGATLGGTMGAAGHGLMRLGQRGVQGLRNARQDALAQETLAAREAAEAGQEQLAKEAASHRELVGVARGMMQKDFALREAQAAKKAQALEAEHGKALEANKLKDRRASLDAAKASDRERALLGQARELNKRYDANRAKELERQIAEAEMAAEAERRMLGQAREMNKAKDSRDRNMVGQAREINKRVDGKGLERAKQILARARAKNEDPGTRVLEGYAGKAGERRAVNYDRVKAYREDIHDPNMNTQAAGRLQRYIDKYGDAVDDPAAFERRMVERFLHGRFPNDPDRVARIMRERIGPGGEVLPRRGASPVAAGADEVAPPSLAEEAETAMAARRGEAPLLAAGDEGAGLSQLQPASARAPVRPLDAPWTPNAPRPVSESPLAPLPSRRPGNTMMDVGGQRGPEFSQARTGNGLGGMAGVDEAMAARRGAAAGANAGAGQARRPVTGDDSMLSPVDAPEPPTRATNVLELRRPALPAPAPSGRADTVRMRPPAAPAPRPAGAADEIQDVTRLAAPEDVAPLAAERAMARERGALGTLGEAGMAGISGSPNVLGGLVAGAANITRAALNDPAVKARALAAAKVHLLAQINPEVFAKVGGQLAQAAAGGPGRYNAISYVHARKDPEFRKAESAAAERASRMSDEQLMQLLSSPAGP